ncbi:uncharacterized protein LOC142230202 [Haematobia irritans]|uniref:uncharacterized protein LOC142230202 n=1 Tax=Haematobia irritans TaxID=7368 RepID=UPI003F506E5B
MDMDKEETSCSICGLDHEDFQSYNTMTNVEPLSSLRNRSGCPFSSRNGIGSPSNISTPNQSFSSELELSEFLPPLNFSTPNESFSSDSHSFSYYDRYYDEWTKRDDRQDTENNTN